MATVTEQVQIKQWAAGRGKTEVHLSWMSDKPNFVRSTTVAATRNITVNQYEKQEAIVIRSIKNVMGWDAEAGISEHNEDGTEATGWHKVD